MTTMISESQRLAMTLRFLAARESQDTLAWTYRCGQSTVCGIITDTVQVLVNILQPPVLVPPGTTAEWEAIAAGFWSPWNFPHCVGAIDGKHMQIHCPQTSGSLFSTTKSFLALLLAVCDADYNFIFLNVGAEGSQSDGGIFKQSELGKRLAEGSLSLPPPCLLPQRDITFPYVMVGDAAFHLTSYMMKPYGGQRLSIDQSVFNYRLSRVRREVENSFGILAARWRIFRRTICATEETANNIIPASVVLHNFILQTGDRNVREAYCPASFLDMDTGTGDLIQGEWHQVVSQDGNGGAIRNLARTGSRNARQRSLRLRDTLKDYLNDVGAVPWQNNVVQMRMGEMNYFNANNQDDMVNVNDNIQDGMIDFKDDIQDQE